MYNYYNFNFLNSNKETIKFYNSMPTKELISYLNINFDDLYFYINNYADVFKTMFNGRDYDEFYHSAKSLIEELNNIKIILNILRKRDKHE